VLLATKEVTVNIVNKRLGFFVRLTVLRLRMFIAVNGVYFMSLYGNYSINVASSAFFPHCFPSTVLAIILIRALVCKYAVGWPYIAAGRLSSVGMRWKCGATNRVAPTKSGPRPSRQVFAK
jgi:hypothetical protein